jgi:lysophospholipid acyltransferase (LPLAT)-like uncharacterized protein
MTMKDVWRRVRKPLARSPVAKRVLAGAISVAFRFIRWTNPIVEGSSDVAALVARHGPVIFTGWHGQHLTAPLYWSRDMPVVVMISKSADAEVNAMVLKHFGLKMVRGSGGRHKEGHIDKGGAFALVALKKTLDAGSNAFMIADIPHGTPRDSGLGIIMLARLSGRPIIPMGLATTRRKVFEKSWDKTTLSLPFGRSALVAGEPFYVDKKATPEEMEERRRALTDAIDAATARAYDMVDRPR